MSNKRVAPTQDTPISTDDAQIVQIGIVVKDLQHTIELLTNIGLGPFDIREVEHPSALIHNTLKYYKVRVAIARQGAIELELIEPLEGHSVQQEALDEKGEGLHHIMFMVNNLDETLERFSDLACDTILEDRFIGGGGVAYVETKAAGGLVMEVAQLPDNFQPGDPLRYVER